MEFGKYSKINKAKGLEETTAGELHFYLILQVPFPWPRNIFLAVNQTFSQPVCLPLHQFYFQFAMHFCPMFTICNVYF